MRIFLILFALLFSTGAFAQGQLLDKVVAVVNSQVITQSQLNQQLAVTRAQIQAQGRPVPLQSELQKEALDQLIDLTLQKEVAKKAHITVSDSEVNNAIADIAAQNHINLSTLQQSLVQQGISYSAYKHRIHDQILMQKITQSAIGGKVKVTPQDVENARSHMPALAMPHSNASAQYHVLDILVSSREVANQLLKKIRAGESPQKLLNSNPDVKIADLGFRPLSGFPNIFSKSIQTLKAGEFSDPIKAPNGFHILNLQAVQGSGAKNVASSISAEQVAYQRKSEEAMKQWIQKLRSQSYVKIVD